MNAIIKRLRQMADDELLAISEAIDAELERRMALSADEVPVSARRRAVERQKSYRRRLGSAAPPVYAVGLGKQRDIRRAA
jgi:hypothetical protein